MDDWMNRQIDINRQTDRDRQTVSQPDRYTDRHGQIASPFREVRRLYANPFLGRLMKEQRQMFVHGR